LLAQLNEISLSFPDKSVLDDVSLTVYPRDRRALVGENGSGKTSLFRILTGATQVRCGRRLFCQRSSDRTPRAGLRRPRQRGCTFLEVALEPFACLIRLEQRIDHLGAELAKQRTQESTDKLLSELGEAQRGAWRQR
jgi:ATPase subunit of ABC transporter with duplicated ATPase domains